MVNVLDNGVVERMLISDGGRKKEKLRRRMIKIVRVMEIIGDLGKRERRRIEEEMSKGEGKGCVIVEWRKMEKKEELVIEIDRKVEVDKDYMIEEGG